MWKCIGVSDTSYTWVKLVSEDSEENPPQDGEDGFSPIATVTQTATGATISITDKNGTTTATVTNGKDGAKGDKGDKGDTGATGPAGADGAKGDKGDTGAQGDPGKDGANGKDGVSATHSWNGTTLTITSASGTSSADLKGAKGDKGDTGATGPKGDKGDKGDTGATGKDGSDGAPGVPGADGADGYTPIKGVDYYTEADKSEFSEYIASELAKRGQLKPEFANSIEECTDTSKLYVLPDGYIYAYMLIEREVETGGGYTNLATEFAVGKRFKSDGSLVDADGAIAVLDYIPYTNGTVVRVQGYPQKFGQNIALYTSDKGIWAIGTIDGLSSYVSYQWDDATGTSTLTAINDKASFLRVAGNAIGTTDDIIITVNEEITEGVTEIITEYAWANTGHAFIPADYEERIIDLEEDVLQLKNTVGTQGGSTGEAVTLPAYWEPEVEAKAAIVKAHQEAGGKNCVSFVHAADLHIDDNDNGRTTDIGKVISTMLDRCHIPWAVLSGDINTRASYGTEAGLLEAQSAMPEHLAPLWGTERLLMALGNHDGCWGDSSGYYRHQFSPERMWQVFFRGQALDFRRVFSDDGLYFYVDIVAQKTRFIVLNSHYGGEYAEDANGWAVNNRFGTSCYGQAQLDWLADVALDMPEGYGAVITAHVPPNITYTVDRAQLIGIVNAYNAKSTFTGSYTAGVDGWSNSSINVDFSGAKGEIIAMFTGHVHGDSIDSTTMSCPIITILSAGASANEAYADTAPTRTPGTATETSFDVVTINRRTRMIYCARVGAGDNREVGY